MLLLCVSVDAQITSYASPPYQTGFESGTLDANWTTATTAQGGRIRPHLDSSLVWSGAAARSYQGSYFLGLDDSIGGSFQTQEAWMGLDLNGRTGVTLDFWFSDWNDENHPQDGVYFSDNGGTTFSKVLDLVPQSYPDLVYQQFSLNVDSLAAAAGLTLSSTFVVKFQQYDNFYFAGGNDGFLIDDVSVTAPANCNASLNCPPNMTVTTDSACTATVNYPDPTVQSDCYQSLLITECNTNSPDMIEVQNMQNATVNYTGYNVVISDDYNIINNYNTTLWPLGSFTAGEYQYRTDGTANPWGSNMFWNSTANSWAIILDPNGDVVDAVFWGWDSVAIAGFNPTINGNVITIPPSVWSGNGVPTNCSNSYARQGTSDNNVASDWACVTVSTGTQNPGWNPTIGGGGSGSAPAPNFVSGLPSGSAFPLGTTTTVWNWADPNLGVSDSCSFTVTVADSTAPTALCQNVTLQLTAAGTVSLTAADVDGGSSDDCGVNSLAVSPSTFTCADLGATTVTLTVDDLNGNASSCTSSVAVVDTAGLTFIPVNLGPDGSICNGSTVTLDAGAGQSSYAWSTGDTSQTIQVNMSGSYAVTVTSQQGCTGSDIIALSTHTVPASNPMANGGPAVICTGGSLDLIADPGFQSYAWSTGSTQQTATATTGGIITVVVSDTTGCTRVDSINVTSVNAPAPVASITPAGNPIYGCGGAPVTLDAGSGFNMYSWSNGSAQQTISVNAGNYSVTVFDANSCWDASSVVTVIDTNATVPVLTVVGDSICAPAGAMSYSWTLNGNTLPQTTPCIFGAASGTYACEVTEQTGCSATGSTMFVGIENGIGQSLFAEAAPNPFRDATQISFEAPYLCSATLKVFSLTGEHVATLYDGEVSPGVRQQVEFRPEGISNGMYLFRLTTDQGDVATGKVMYMR